MRGHFDCIAAVGGMGLRRRLEASATSPPVSRRPHPAGSDVVPADGPHRDVQPVARPEVRHTDIAELRDIHLAIDEAVVRAYVWTNLLESGMGHGFHDTRQRTRYTIGPVVRQEILGHLLELNHARYATEEAAGLHKKVARKRVAKDSAGDISSSRRSVRIAG